MQSTASSESTRGRAGRSPADRAGPLAAAAKTNEPVQLTTAEKQLRHCLLCPLIGSIATYAGDEPLQIQRDVRRKRQLVGGLRTRYRCVQRAGRMLAPCGRVEKYVQMAQPRTGSPVSVARISADITGERASMGPQQTWYRNWPRAYQSDALVYSPWRRHSGASTTFIAHRVDYWCLVSRRLQRRRQPSVHVL